MAESNDKNSPERDVLSDVVTITSGQFAKIIQWLSIFIIVLMGLVLLVVFMYRESVNSKPPSRIFAVTESGVLKELIGSPYQFMPASEVGRKAKFIIEDLFTFTFRELQDGSHKKKISKYFYTGDEKLGQFINYINNTWANRVAKNLSFVTAYGIDDYPTAIHTPIISNSGDQKLHEFEFRIQLIEDLGAGNSPIKEGLHLIFELAESDSLSSTESDQYKIVQIKFKNI